MLFGPLPESPLPISPWRLFLPAGISVAARPRSGPMRNWALWNYTIPAAASAFLGNFLGWRISG